MMKIIFDHDAVKAIKRMPSTVKSNIKQRIEKLTNTPPEGDIKLLKGYTDGRFRLRVGDYRIIYKYVVDNGEQTLYIVEIGTRGDIYK